MRAKQVEIGKRYWCKVSGKVVPVRIIERTIGYDGRTHWYGINTETNRRVFLRSSRRLRGEVPERVVKDEA